MPATDSDQVVADADAIYSLAFEEWHCAAPPYAIAELTGDWQPISRAGRAMEYLIRQGFAELETHSGIGFLLLTNPLTSLSR